MSRAPAARRTSRNAAAGVDPDGAGHGLCSAAGVNFGTLPVPDAELLVEVGDAQVLALAELRQQRHGPARPGLGPRFHAISASVLESQPAAHAAEHRTGACAAQGSRPSGARPAQTAGHSGDCRCCLLYVAEVPAQPLVVQLDRHRALTLLLVLGLGLLLSSAAWQVAKYNGWQPVSLFVDRVIDADSDASIANWFSSSLFLLGGLAAGGVALRDRSRRLAWAAMAAVLLAVSADEALGLHDILKPWVLLILKAGDSSTLLLGLVALAGALLLAVVLTRLPRAPRLRFGVAAVLLLVGAVGVDTLGPDLLDDPDARLAPSYLAKAYAEELSELLVALLALDAGLLGLLGGAQGTISAAPSTTATVSPHADAAPAAVAPASRAVPAESQPSSGRSSGNAVQTTRGDEL